MSHSTISGDDTNFGLGGRSRTLEELGLGINARKQMEKEERDHWHAFAPRSPVP